MTGLSHTEVKVLLIPILRNLLLYLFPFFIIMDPHVIISSPPYTPRGVLNQE